MSIPEQAQALANVILTFAFISLIVMAALMAMFKVEAWIKHKLRHQIRRWVRGIRRRRVPK